MMTTIVFVVYVLLFIVITILVFWLTTSGLFMVFGHAPFVPVQNHALAPILNELHLTTQSVFIDPGCGDAKVLIAAAKEYSHTKMIGIEHDLIPYLIAKFNTRNYPNITIIRKNFFDYNFSQATHIYTYLFPQIMNRLYPLFEQQLQSGTILVSCDFAFTQKQPIKTVELKKPTDKKLAKKLLVYHF